MNIIGHLPLDGEARKWAAHHLLACTRERVVRRARRALLMHLLAHGTATADDVRAVVELPPGLNPKAFGAVPGPLAEAGIIRAAGFAKTARATGRARPVTVWRLADAAAATVWLLANPELPDADLNDPFAV